VKQQVKPQSKPQVEQEKKPHAPDKIYHEDSGDMGKKKKKTRRGGRKSRSSKDLTHIKCFE
jgi:BRCT domain type II-containing protein